MKENDNVIELEKVKEENEKKRINKLVEGFILEKLDDFLKSLPDTYNDLERNVAITSYAFTAGYLYGKEDAKKENK
jgi:hypothetical protein